MTEALELIKKLAMSDTWHQEEKQRLVDAQLTLLQNCLIGAIYEDPPLVASGANHFDAQIRKYGRDWPSQAHTMIGEKRLSNVRMLCEIVIGLGIEGDFIETGVWRGGACIMMRGVLSAWGVTDRTVWVADSFEGLPRPNADKYPADSGDKFYTFPELSVSLEEVKNNFKKYGLLDQQVKFIKGWFKDTLLNAPINKLAILRLDGDLYESTMDALQALYDKVTDNGYVIIDDYHVVAGCKNAVHDFFTLKNITPKIIEIDGVGIYWQKNTMSAFGKSLTLPVIKNYETYEKLLIDHFVTQENKILSLNYEIEKILLNLQTEKKKIIDLTSNLIKEGNQVSELTNILRFKEEKIQELSFTLQNLLQSLSWQITQPFRSITSIFKNHLIKKSNDLDQKPPSHLIWKSNTQLQINEINFNLSIDTKELQDQKSSQTNFLLGKSRYMVEKSEKIGQKKKILKVFEMGIFQGGSVVLYDNLWSPEKIVAIDYNLKSIEPLEKYIQNLNKQDQIKTFYGINQADKDAMENILNSEFPDRDIDFIIDDASHLYQETRSAFNICFPYLKEGGLYCIEDWAWAHWPGDFWQNTAPDTFLHGKTAMSNLLIELFMLAASRRDLITSIVIEHSLITVTKGPGVIESGVFNISDHYLLRGKSFEAWL
ncbi:MAG TPA: TylF/MycF/NovP-related O-methyltransferase [Burkholderiaceae bacterium]|nr:TylF/MycF/NovP-related O-methyltransferase [Burkholderiaceae bacterium]